MTFWNTDIRAENNMQYQTEQVQTRVAQVLYVRLNPIVGQFSSVQSALASITDASVSKTYLIDVGPGTYLEPTLSMKSYVWVRGSGSSTIIQTNSSNQNVVTGAPNAIISDCVLTGAGTG